MKITERYLGLAYMQMTAIILVMLIGFCFFMTLISEIGDIGTGAYRFIDAIEFALLDLPKQIYGFFPIACLLGALLGLGSLATHSELIILRASGMSVAKITWALIKTTIVLLVVMTFIGEGISPIAEHTAKDLKATLTTNGQALKTRAGTWIRDGQDFIYIHTIYGSRNLEGITRYSFDTEHHLTNVTYAQNAVYTPNGWNMQNIVDSSINTKQIKTSAVANATWKLSLNPDVVRISVADPTEMSLKQLQSYLLYLKKNNLNITSYLLNFWQRVLQPLATLVMVWLAIPFVLGPLRSASMGIRTVLGAVVGFTFITLNNFFGPFSVIYQMPPFVAAVIPIIVFSVVAFILQERVR